MRRLFTFLILSGLFGGIFAQTSELIISEYVEGWSNNKALELYNPTDDAVELSEFRLIRYSNGEDFPPPEDTWTVDLPDVSLEAYQTFVVVIDQRVESGSGQTAPVWSQLQQRADAFLCPDYNTSETMYFNGDDAIVIEKNIGGGNWKIHDIFARWGPPAPATAQFVGSEKMDNAWTNVAPYFTGEGVAITAEHTMVKKSSISEGVTSNPAVFNPLEDWDTLTANTFDHLGWHNFDNAPANASPVVNNENLIFAVSPSATNGAEVGQINATDAEGNPLKYYIDYGNFIYIKDVRVEPFDLDKNTGLLSLVDQDGLAPDVLDTFYLSINITDGFSQTGPLTAMVIVTDSQVGTSEIKDISNLKVYPNPVTDRQFSIQDSKAITEISLMNTLGQKVFERSFDQIIYKTDVNIDFVSSGIYILKVKYLDGGTNSLKLLMR